MRDIKRIDKILKALGKLWKEHPDYRFGQMLINNSIVPDDINVWQNEDDAFLEYLEILLTRDR